MPTKDGTTWLWTTSLPRWYRDGGIYAAESTLYGIRREHDRLVRWKPTIPYICSVLMGTSRKREDGSYFATFPSLHRRLAVYEEALNLIALFGDCDDLLTLAVYRRQVHPCNDISLDYRFLELAERFELTYAQWDMLAVRMPPHTHVWRVCKARSVKPSSVVLVAA